MTKTRQFFIGLVIGLGFGMVSLIGFRIGFSAAQDPAPMFVTEGVSERENPAKTRLDLNENAKIDTSWVTFCERVCNE